MKSSLLQVAARKYHGAAASFSSKYPEERLDPTQVCGSRGWSSLDMWIRCLPEYAPMVDLRHGFPPLGKRKDQIQQGQVLESAGDRRSADALLGDTVGIALVLGIPALCAPAPGSGGTCLLSSGQLDAPVLVDLAP